MRFVQFAGCVTIICIAVNLGCDRGQPDAQGGPDGSSGGAQGGNRRAGTNPATEPQSNPARVAGFGLVKDFTADPARVVWTMSTGEDRPVVVVWTDATDATLRPSAVSGGGARSSIRIAPDQKELALESDTIDGKSGTVKLGGATYDLSKGSLFLAYTREQPIRVRQVQRHTADFTLESLMDLAQSEEITRFYAEAAGKGGK